MIPTVISSSSFFTTITKIRHYYFSSYNIIKRRQILLIFYFYPQHNLKKRWYRKWYERDKNENGCVVYIINRLGMLVLECGRMCRVEDDDDCSGGIYHILQTTPHHTSYHIIYPLLLRIPHCTIYNYSIKICNNKHWGWRWWFAILAEGWGERNDDDWDDPLWIMRMWWEVEWSDEWQMADVVLPTLHAMFVERFSLTRVEFVMCTCRESSLHLAPDTDAMAMARILSYMLRTI